MTRQMISNRHRRLYMTEVLSIVSCYLLLIMNIYLFEDQIYVRSNLPRCPDQLTPIAGLVGPVDFVSENGYICQNLSFSK